MAYNRNIDLLDLIDNPSGEDEFLMVDRQGVDGRQVRVRARDILAKVTKPGGDFLGDLQGVKGHSPGPVDMLWIGDSRTAAGNIGLPSRLSANGIQFWAQFHSRGRVRCPLEYNFGIAGQTSTQIRARVAEAAACPAPIAHVLCSINDATGDPSFENVVAIVEALSDTGKIVIVTPELPRISGWDVNRIAQHVAVFDRLRTLTRRGVYISNPWPEMVDYTTLTGGPVAGMFYDSPPIHLANTGAYYVGKAVADVLNFILPEPAILPVTNGGVYNAAYNPRGFLTPNPMFYGTAGVLQGGATGVAADGVTLTRSGSDLTVTAQKVTIAGKVWQEVTLSGTPTTQTNRVTIAQNVTLANLAAGDIIEGPVCELQVDAGSTGMHGPSLEINPVGGSTSGVSTNYDTWGRGLGYAPNVAHSGVLLGPDRVTIQSGLTSFPVQVIARAEQGVACSMTFRVRAMGTRKVL